MTNYVGCELKNKAPTLPVRETFKKERLLY